MPRAVTLHSPLDADLVFQHLEGSERLSELFEYRLQALSTSADLPLDQLLGQSVDIEFETQSGPARHLCAHVSSCQHIGWADGEQQLHRYALELRPWLWMLTRTSDCRTFQQQTIPEIVKTVLSECPVADFDADRLTGRYPKLEYVVQYNESTHDFVARLLEEAGIYWYFEHAQNQHRLILCDSPSAHRSCPGYEDVPLRHRADQDGGLHAQGECLTQWSAGKRLQTGRYAHTSYDFKQPDRNLFVASSQDYEHSYGDAEWFSYPGSHADPDDGRAYAEARTQALRARHERAHAQGNVRGLFTGGLFNLSDHPRADQNREHLVVASWIEVRDPGPQSASGDWRFVTMLELQPSDVPYRPLLRTPRPRIHGSQTAVVVGDPNEEITPDLYGRIKVRFHWDRRAQSSCWIRVAHLAAGAGYGFMSIPRVGHEVVVPFLEGNPDLPLITACVYNDAMRPAHDLPANKAMSSWKGASTPDGTYANANEIRMNDDKGKEQLLLIAEGNHDVEVKKNHSMKIGGSSTKTIEHSETSRIKHDREETVGGAHSESITGNRDVNVTKGGQTNTVQQDITIVSIDGSILISSPKQIQLKVGSSIISITDGSIKILGPQRVDINP